MHFKIDEFHSGPGLLQTIHPAVKLSFIFLVPAVCAVIPSEKAGASFLIALLSFILFKFSGISFKVFLKRLVPMTPFIIYPVVLIIHALIYGNNLFMAENSPLYAKSIDFFGSVIELPSSEMNLAVNLLLKSISTVNVVIVFTATTRFGELMKAFKTFLFPAYFIMIFYSAWRYLETFVNEIITMKIAAGFKFFRPANIFAVKTFSMIFSSILLRSLNRADMNNKSMKFRGYQITNAPRLKKSEPLTARDALFTLITFIFIAFACLL